MTIYLHKHKLNKIKLTFNENMTSKEMKIEMPITANNGLCCFYLFISLLLCPIYVYLPPCPSFTSIFSFFSSTLSLFSAPLSHPLCPSLSAYGGLGWLTAYSMLIGFIQTEDDHEAISNYPHSYQLLQICVLTHFQSTSSLWIKHAVISAV